MLAEKEGEEEEEEERGIYVLPFSSVRVKS